MKSFHFELGNSSDGPVGFCARIKAEDEEEAVAILRDAIEELNRELASPTDLGDNVEYLEVYFNPAKITVADIDEENEENER